MVDKKFLVAIILNIVAVPAHSNSLKYTSDYIHLFLSSMPSGSPSKIPSGNGNVLQTFALNVNENILTSTVRRAQ